MQRMAKGKRGAGVMLLVTGAGGQAGKAVVKSFAEKGIDVCAMVHRESQMKQMEDMGAARVVAGDMMNPDNLRYALEGADGIYDYPASHIYAEYSDVIGADKADRNLASKILYRE